MDNIAQVDAAFPWLFPSFVFVFGACIGSFLNVVIYRLPAGMSLSYPGSTCACGTRIAWFDNIPILGWLVLRGKARCCGRRISVRYPFVELLTALLFWAAWMAHPPAVAVVAMVFVAWMLAPAFIDLDTMEIPDRFSIGGFVLGAVLSLVVPALHGYSGDLWVIDSLRSLLTSIAGGFIASALILWVALLAEVVLRKEAMGFGDVKLMGAIGAFCGWQGGVFALFGGAILGCFGFILAMIWEQALGGTRAEEASLETGESGGDDAENAKEEDVDENAEESLAGRIPFGPALAAAAVLYLVWLQPWVDAYFKSFSDVLFRR